MSTESSTISALDLNSEVPRSPRETLGGYVVAARTLDKCRAELSARQLFPQFRRNFGR